MNAYNRFAEDPLLEEFALETGADRRLLVRRGYERLLLEGLDNLATAAESSHGGRQPHPVVLLRSGEKVMIRRFLRGGVVRHFNRDTYFFGNRALEELRVTLHAARAGVAVPRIIGAAEERKGFGYTAWIAVCWIHQAENLSDWLPLASARDALEALRATGANIGVLHRAGIAHPDLNLRNVLLAPANSRGPSPILIDFDRARLLPSAVSKSLRSRALLRFARSARKLSVAIGTDGWAAFQAGYGPDWPLARSLG